MASTFSTDLKLELMATGENAGTWGTKTKLRDEKRREKHTNQQKRMNRSKKNDITLMKRNQMKKCQIR